MREKILLALSGKGDISSPKGMAFVFENLYEMQSLIKCLLALEKREIFYQENYFFTSLFVSHTYSTALLARQLFSKSKGKDGTPDHSLKLMWYDFLTESERESFPKIKCFIDKEFKEDFEKLNRNILHNEISNAPNLIEIVDKFLNYGAEIIGIFSKKADCHVKPAISNEIVFKGLNKIFTDEEIEIMKTIRKQYLNELLIKTNHPNCSILSKV